MSYRVEVRGSFGGATGGWRPAITGTLNQTGNSDAEASTFPTEEEADEAAKLAYESVDIPREFELRLVEVSA